MSKGLQEPFTPEEAGYQVVQKRYLTAVLKNLETGEQEIFLHDPRAVGFVVQIQARPYSYCRVLD